MNPQKYDKSSVKSIYNFSCQLTGKTLAQVVELPFDVVNQKNRGDLGRLVEIHFFQHNPPNDHNPDFAEAGIELKTTGTLDYKKNSKIRGDSKSKRTDDSYKYQLPNN